MKKNLGQIFLIDKNIAKKIVMSLDLQLQDTVIEIGPGNGVLTEYILKKKIEKLIGIELDRGLVEKLKEKFPNKYFQNFEIINNDFLKINTNDFNQNIKFIGNIPYRITSRILKKIFEFKNWQLCVLMVQKEVGERILSEPGNKKYGVLTLLVQFYADVEKIINKISPECFYPKPNVYSTVIKLIRKPILYSVDFTKNLFNLINNAFSKRRKTILNSLSTGLNIGKNILVEYLKKSNINPEIRPECISLKQYILLYSILKNNSLK